jgi:hypothetical protein
MLAGIISELISLRFCSEEHEFHGLSLIYRRTGFVTPSMDFKPKEQVTNLLLHWINILSKSHEI